MMPLPAKNTADQSNCRILVMCMRLSCPSSTTAMLHCRVCRNVTLIDFSPSLMSSYVWFVQMQPRHALAEWFTLAPCSWTYNVQVVRSGVQLSSWHGAAVSTRRHSAYCWSNVATSTAVCIVIRFCGASNTSFIAWIQSLCCFWT